MTYVSLIISEEAAPTCVRELGILGCVQFSDLSPECTPFQRRYVSKIKRCDELERRIRYLHGEAKKLKVRITPGGSVDDFVTNAHKHEGASGTYLLESLETKLERYENQFLELNKYSNKLSEEYTSKVTPPPLHTLLSQPPSHSPRPLHAPSRSSSTRSSSRCARCRTSRPSSTARPTTLQVMHHPCPLFLPSPPSLGPQKSQNLTAHPFYSLRTRPKKNHALRSPPSPLLSPLPSQVHELHHAEGVQMSPLLSGGATGDAGKMERGAGEVMEFSNIAGTIAVADRTRFERMLFRTTRGNCYVRFAAITDDILDAQVRLVACKPWQIFFFPACLFAFFPSSFFLSAHKPLLHKI